ATSTAIGICSLVGVPHAKSGPSCCVGSDAIRWLERAQEPPSMNSSSPERTGAKPSALERVLGLVTEVRPGESASALLLTLNVFLLLAAYYVMKPVREGLILELKGGAELKSWMSAVMTIVLVGLVPAYSAFANRVRRNRLVV